MFVKFKLYFFLNTKQPAPGSELSICLISLAISNKHIKFETINLRHKKRNAVHNIHKKNV